MVQMASRALAAILIPTALLIADVPSQAATSLDKQAWASCKKKYGKALVSAEVRKGGKEFYCTFTTPAKPMSSAEAYEACKKKYKATAVIVVKAKDGWRCRYRTL